MDEIYFGDNYLKQITDDDAITVNNLINKIVWIVVENYCISKLEEAEESAVAWWCKAGSIPASSLGILHPLIVHLIINMINMYIKVPTRTSTAIDELKVDLLARKALVTFVNGYEYEYTNVSARAIAQVLFNPWYLSWFLGK